MKPSFVRFLEVNINQNIPLDLDAFRERELWTKEVNDLLRINQSLIGTVLAMKKQGLHPLSYEDIESIFVHEASPRIVSDEHILIQACAFSRQALIRDYHDADKVLMDQFTREQFYEILARVVDA